MIRERERVQAGAETHRVCCNALQHRQLGFLEAESPGELSEGGNDIFRTRVLPNETLEPVSENSRVGFPATPSSARVCIRGLF